MAFVVITSILGIVDNQLLQPHPPLNNILDDAQEEIVKSLTHNLRYIQAMLQEKKAVNQALEAEIRDVAIEVEAKIESHLGALYLAAHINGDSAVAEARDRLHQTLQQVAEDIQSLEDRIRSEEKNISKNEMIGCNDEFQKIKEAIIDQQSSGKLEVISVTGMGGIGKTTLAKKIYEDPQIGDHFDIRAWSIVSQDHHVKEILIRLLHCIDPTTSKIYNEEYGKLQEQVKRSLLGRRYLIVIDDIWNYKAWDDIKQCFPDNEIGSRILMTTRNIMVAEYASSSTQSVHSMRKLNTDESWSLFEKKVFPENDSCDPELESIGKSIVKKCHGLPLAILVMAGLVAKLEKSPEVWSDVVENMNLVDHENRLLGMLGLSYNYLPIHLKACLMYLGVFPEDSEIPVNKLINLWVAEGFLKEEGNKNLEQVAESYLDDLINRSLVQVSKRSLDGKIKTCRLHDMLRDMCMKEAQREKFLSVTIPSTETIPSTDIIPSGSRWISCSSTHWPASDKVHSILYFGKDVHLAKSKLEFTGLKMLRVLDLSLIKCWQGLPDEIADLVHLRYLALSALGSLSDLQLIKLQNLQTFIVWSWRKGCCLQLPGGILELPRLRHVRVDKRSSLYLPTMVQENLQTLLWLKVIGQDPRTTNFETVPNLKELWVYVDNQLPPGALDSLVHLHLLEKLKFEMGSIERFHLPTALPEHLKKLTLRNTYLPWEDMDIIARLKHLEVLKLKDFAFSGPKWKPEDVEFKGLKLLFIARSNLKYWEADNEHFPTLEHIVLRFCWDLKELPIQFASINTLRLIEIDGYYPSLVKSAKKIRKEQRDIGNDALVINDLGLKIELPVNESSEDESESYEDDESYEE